MIGQTSLLTIYTMANELFNYFFIFIIYIETQLIIKLLHSLNKYF